MLIKSYDDATYAICCCVTVNIWPFLLLSQCGFIRRTQDVCASSFHVFLGGRFAIRTRLVSRPAISIRTMDTSPLACLYSALSCVVWSMSRAYCISTDLMKTWHRGPSLCIIETMFCRAQNIVDPAMNFKGRNQGALMVKVTYQSVSSISMMSAPTIGRPYYCLQCV